MKVDTESRRDLSTSLAWYSMRSFVVSMYPSSQLSSSANSSFKCFAPRWRDLASSRNRFSRSMSWTIVPSRSVWRRRTVPRRRTSLVRTFIRPSIPLAWYSISLSEAYSGRVARKAACAWTGTMITSRIPSSSDASLRIRDL